MSNDESNQWEERMSRSRNIPYYFNRSTGETVWERPEGFFSQGMSIADISLFVLMFISACVSSAGET